MSKTTLTVTRLMHWSSTQKPLQLGFFINAQTALVGLGQQVLGTGGSVLILEPFDGPEKLVLQRVRVIEGGLPCCQFDQMMSFTS